MQVVKMMRGNEGDKSYLGPSKATECHSLSGPERGEDVKGMMRDNTCVDGKHKTMEMEEEGKGEERMSDNEVPQEKLGVCQRGDGEEVRGMMYVSSLH